MKVDEVAEVNIHLSLVTVHLAHQEAVIEVNRLKALMVVEVEVVLSRRHTAVEAAVAEALQMAEALSVAIAAEEAVEAVHLADPAPKDTKYSIVFLTKVQLPNANTQTFFHTITPVNVMFYLFIYTFLIHSNQIIVYRSSYIS